MTTATEGGCRQAPEAGGVMTQAEYNAKVQEIQAMWSEDAQRFDMGRSGTAWFQVYWNGHWQTLGAQHRPFQPDTEYEWDHDKEIRLRGRFAAALSRS